MKIVSLLKNPDVLKVASFVIGLVGMGLSAEVRKRETREMIDEALDKREQERAVVNNAPVDSPRARLTQ